MNRRTSGDDPERVGILAAAYVDGLADAGVIGVIKHFPGHGGAADSHAQLPRIDTDRETAFATSLHSFEIAIQEGVPAVMVGHLYYSDIEPTPNLPASLSPTMIGILLDDFDFSGVVMSDAFDMSAIYDNFYADYAALMFIRAGGDMLVSGPFLPWAMQLNIKNALIAAVEDGTLSESRIDESVRRILELKAAYGLLEWEPIDTESLHIDLDATQNALIEVYMDAATLLRDDNHLLPLAPDDDIVFVYPKIFPDIPATCGDLAPDAAFHGYLLHVADWEFEVVRQMGIEHEKIVIFTLDAFFTERQIELVKLLPPEKTIVVALGLPYDLERVPEVSTAMAMYNSLPASHIAACNVLMGQHDIIGRLP
ncbi:MAG TPA: glycoside hydrolase family 3 N-terminal domain-containing protein, partial [Aggregatilineales bacterium]|nr:glycoside hydrolase family 3 N-terminal domain-containing protein [Aggregatilineales bacterium]